MPLVTMDMAMSHALKTSHIIPGLVDPNFESQGLLDVVYSGNEHVELGNHLTPAQTAQAPTIMYIPANEEPNALYTLLLLDPDAPSSKDPKFSPYRHWVVGNIPAQHQDQVNAAANQVTAYAGPTPPAGTGDHRYVFLLYKQAAQQSYSPTALGQDRRSFKYKDFVQQHQLQLVAVNFFLASNP
ncbi:phosphatidylethanolamine-binding protein [Gongronella butleri]|nr:phosphatidylethanolamine-binding protein [Gongronella butleri]